MHSGKKIRETPSRSHRCRRRFRAVRRLSFLLAFVLLFTVTSCARIPAPEPEEEKGLLRNETGGTIARLGLSASARDSVREWELPGLPPLDVEFLEGTDEKEEESPSDPILQQLLTHELHLPVVRVEHYHPLVPRNAYDYSLNDFLFASLFRADLRGEPFPELVETVRYNRAHTIMEVTLHDDFRFSDGTPVEAEDVLRGFEILCDEPSTPLTQALHETSPWTKDLTNILAVERIDAFGLRIYLEEADPYLHYALNFPILKRDQWDKTGIVKTLSSGPYGLESFDKDRYRLVYRPEFAAKRREPKLKTIYLKDYPDAAQVREAFIADETDLCIARPGEDPRLDAYRYRPLTMPENMSLRFNLPDGDPAALEEIRLGLYDIYNDDRLFRPVAPAIEPAKYPFFPQHTAWQQLNTAGGVRNRPEVYADKGEAKAEWTLLASRGDLFSEDVARSVALIVDAMGYTVTILWLDPEAYEAAREAGEYDMILETYEMSMTPDPEFFTDSDRRRSPQRPDQPFFFTNPEQAAMSREFFAAYELPEQGTAAVLASPDYAYYYEQYTAAMNFLSILHYRQAVYLSDRIEGSLYPLPLRPLNGWEGWWKWSEHASQLESSSSTK